MFKAMIIVCLMGNPNACKTIEDLLGPYEEMEECKLRLEEMRIDLLTEYVASLLLPYSGHCIPTTKSNKKVSV